MLYFADIGVLTSSHEPKSQLAEQLSLKKSEAFQKGSSTDIKKEPKMRPLGKADYLSNQIPYPMDGQPISYRLIILHKFSHRSESSDTHIRPPSCGRVSSSGKRSPQSNWLWRSRGFDCRRTAELGEIDMSQGSHKISCTLGSRGKAVISQKPEADLLAGLRRSAGLPWGHRYQWRTYAGYSSAWTLLKAVILLGSLSPKHGSTQEPVVPVLGCLKPDH